MVVFLDTPTTVELSHWMGDLGCDQPISMRLFQIVTMALAQMNRPAVSYLAAEEITNLMSWATVRTGLLLVGTEVSLESMVFAPSRLCALLKLRYAASECTARTMSLVRKRMPSLG